MAELSALRARLRDRQVKEGALGTTETSICLDMSLIAELEQLQEDQAQWSQDHRVPSSDSGSLAGKATGPSNPFDELVLAKQDEVRGASIIVMFRAMSSSDYERLANSYDDVDGEDQIKWLDALVAACYMGAWSDGERVDKADLPWSEIQPAISFSETFDLRSRVFDLNKRKQNIPFSSRPSKKPRPLDATPKPA